MTEPTGWPHMLPCPFCGGDARHDAHADDCYFILHRKFKNSGADMSPAFEVLAAWNRRTPQPTQPQAGAVPQCWCLTCRPMRFDDPYSIRMALCPTCGNKRCPKANALHLGCFPSVETAEARYLAAREIILSGLPNDEAHRRIKALKDSPYAEA